MLPFNGRDIIVSENIAYISNSINKYMKFDISDPSNIQAGDSVAIYSSSNYFGGIWDNEIIYFRKKVYSVLKSYMYIDNITDGSSVCKISRDDNNPSNDLFLIICMPNI